MSNIRLTFEPSGAKTDGDGAESTAVDALPVGEDLPFGVGDGDHRLRELAEADPERGDTGWHDRGPSGVL